MTDIDKLEALAKAATVGPWRLLQPSPIDKNWKVTGPSDSFALHSFGFDHAVDEQSKANAQFVATANPAAILELCAELRAWRNASVAHHAFVGACNDADGDETPEVVEAHRTWVSALAETEPYELAAIKAASTKGNHDRLA